MKLLLLEYNSYFNRVAKRETTAAGYADYKVGEVSGVNFIPGDGIATTQIVNIADTAIDYVVCVDESTGGINSRWFVTGRSRTRNGQYLLTLKRDTVADFIDAIADSPAFIEKGNVSPRSSLIFNEEGGEYSQIKTSETMLKDSTGSAWVVAYLSANPDTTVSQLTRTAYVRSVADLVVDSLSEWTGYRYIGKKTYSKSSFSYDLEGAFQDLSSYGSWPTLFTLRFTSYYASSRSLEGTCETNPNVTNGLYHAIGTPGEFYAIAIPGNEIPEYGSIPDAIAKIKAAIQDSEQIGTNIGNNPDAWRNLASATIGSDFYAFQEDSPLDSYDGLTIYEKSTGKRYKLTVSTSAAAIDTDNLETQMASRAAVNDAYRKWVNDGILAPLDLKYTKNASRPYIGFVPVVYYDEDGNLMSGIESYPTYSPSGVYSSINGHYAGSVKTLTAEEITDTSETDVSYVGGINYVPTTAMKLSDAPYAAVCAPYKSSASTLKIGSTSMTMDDNATISMITALASNSGLIYDIQILPYCPLASKFALDGDVLTADSSLTYFLYGSATITGGNVGDPGVSFTMTDYKGAFFYMDRSSFSVDIQTIVGMKNVGKILTLIPGMEEYERKLAKAVKKENETVLYRLCSPNFASSFDFSGAKNGFPFTRYASYPALPGVTDIALVEGFNADCTYKPYTPYIHVAPNFGGMYGVDFNDARGLICSGDFSVSQYSDDFATYALQNKNYQLAFDRQIESLEFQRDESLRYSWQKFGVNSANKALGGIGSGVPGAIEAAAGIGLGALSTQLTAAHNDRLTNEAIDYQTDIFNYSLANVQALPYTINKVTTINENNKIWPFLEKYECSAAEAEAFEAKLEYNGLSWMAISTPIQAMAETGSEYLKARLIRVSGLGEDSHILSDIANELQQGVYISLESIKI